MPMKPAPSKNFGAHGGYTLIELVVAVGLFALVMTLAAGSYILMLDLNRQAQGVATGINSLSFALETMTRSIRTGTRYNCGDLGGDCPNGGNKLSFQDASGADITYARGVQGSDDSTGTIVKNGSIVLTDPSVSVSSLTFYVSGTGSVASRDYEQPYVTIVVSGTVSSGPKNAPQPFTVETGAAMRGIDLSVTLAPSENPPLPTCTLTADPPSVLSGGSSQLSWTTTNAASFSINRGIGAVSPADQGLFTVGPLSATTTYTGTATNAEGTGTCEAMVGVTPQ